MGGFFSSAIDNIRHKYFNKAQHILMSGLDAAGKTTILYKLKVSDMNHYPIIGYNVETIEYANITFSCFDVGGWDKKQIDYSRDWLSQHYYHNPSQNITALIWVIDSTDMERIALDINTNNFEQNGNKTSSKDELHFILNQTQLKNVLLLIFANKAEMPNAMDLESILETLDISTIKQNWFAIQSTATTGHGLYPGLDWLSHTLKAPNKNKQPLFDDYGKEHKECVSWFCKGKHDKIFENKKKTILFVSGWIRKLDQQYKLKMSCNLTAMIHQYYQDMKIPFDTKYKYYG